MGADPISGINGLNGSILGSKADMIVMEKWTAAGLSTEEQVSEVLSVMKRRRDSGPIFSFSYFSQSMANLVAAKSRPLPPPSEKTSVGLGDLDKKMARWNRTGATQKAH